MAAYTHAPSHLARIGGDGLSARASRFVARLLARITSEDGGPHDGEIGRLIARSGGRLTDGIEREIEQRVLDHAPAGLH